MNEIKTRRRFSREFKLEAVEISLRGNKSVAEVARDLEIRAVPNLRWVS